jgi:hypothetical protein
MRSHGIEVGVGLFLAAWLLAWLQLWPSGQISWLKKLVRNHNFNFEPPGEKGAFEKLLGKYMDISKAIIGLASGTIALVAGSASFRATGKLPASFASPLCLLAVSILYAVLFMVFEMLNYEDFRHGANRYSRFKYSRNMGLGFGGLLCFCVGYIWLVFIVTG